MKHVKAKRPSKTQAKRDCVWAKLAAKKAESKRLGRVFTRTSLTYIPHVAGDYTAL